METEKMIYLVTEFASGGEIFGKGSQLSSLIVFGVASPFRCFLSRLDTSQKSQSCKINKSNLMFIFVHS